MTVKYTLYVFIITFIEFTSQTQAYEICNDFENDAFICYDTYQMEAYCCDYYDLDFHKCCYYTKVWTLWYFWVAIVFGLLLISCLIGCCKKMSQKNNRNNDVVNQNTQLATVTTSNYTQPQVNTEFKVDAPPSYEQLEVQAVNNQVTGIPGSNTNPTVPTVPYPLQPYPTPASPVAHVEQVAYTVPTSNAS